MLTRNATKRSVKSDGEETNQPLKFSKDAGGGKKSRSKVVMHGSKDEVKVGVQNGQALKPNSKKVIGAHVSAAGFSPDVILPHGSYLLNCGAPNAETLKKSREVIVDELQRCEKLGLTMYNFHPGSTCGTITIEECLDRIGETINLAHKQTKYVMTVVENMSRQGFTVGGDFNELQGIIDRVEDKSRIGICLDTCHAFAAGYDLSTKNGFQKMMTEFEAIVGLKYLKALHLNDSKGKMGTRLDRHANIGKGYIGTEAFIRIVNDVRFDGLPMILETPYTSDEVYAKEISLLYSLEYLKD